MDCYTKQRCPGCQPMPQGPQCRQGVPMGPGPVIRPDLPLGSGPAVRPDIPMGPGPAVRPDMPMGPGPIIQPDMMAGRNYASRPETPENLGAAVPANSIGQYPIAMAYVPWQRWQQVYPVDKALSRGTIFPDLDKPFMMGRCR